jgi:hypothetical protein
MHQKLRMVKIPVLGVTSQVLNYQEGWMKGIPLYMKYTLLTVSLLNHFILRLSINILTMIL